MASREDATAVIKAMDGQPLEGKTINIVIVRISFPSFFFQTQAQLCFNVRNLQHRDNRASRSNRLGWLSRPQLQPQLAQLQCQPISSENMLSYCRIDPSSQLQYALTRTITGPKYYQLHAQTRRCIMEGANPQRSQGQTGTIFRDWGFQEQLYSPYKPNKDNRLVVFRC